MDATLSRKQTGFSLIELMVAVGIVAVLAAIAIPTYQSSVRKSRRVEARTALLDLAGREEKLYSVSNTYSTDFTQLGWNATAASMVVGSGYYQVSIAAANPVGAQSTYTLTATPAAGSDQTNDTACQTFTVNYLGVQQATDGGGADATSTCWK